MNHVESQVNIQPQALQQQITTVNVAINTITLESTNTQNAEDINKLIVW